MHNKREIEQQTNTAKQDFWDSKAVIFYYYFT